MDETLRRAEEFLAELEDDRRCAPPEYQPVVEPYVRALTGSIDAFRASRLGARELNAHAQQIRLSYARDLQRLLPGETPPTARFVRN